MSLYLTSFEMILLPWGRGKEIFQGLVLHGDSRGIEVYWPHVPLSPSFSLFLFLWGLPSFLLFFLLMGAMREECPMRRLGDSLRTWAWNLTLLCLLAHRW